MVPQFVHHAGVPSWGADVRAVSLEGSVSGDAHTGDAQRGAVDVVELPPQTLIDLLPEAYAAVDVVTRRFVLVNAATERLLGYTRDGLRTMSTSDVLEIADASRLELAYETFAVGTISRREWMLKVRDGLSVPVSVTSVPIAVDGRLIIQMLIHDLSEEGPAAAQRTLLALANDRLAVSLDYETTLRAVVALIVPRLADTCTIVLLDQAGRPRPVAWAARAPEAEDGVRMTIAPLRDSGRIARAIPTGRSEGSDGEAETFDLRAHGKDLGTLTMQRHAPRTWTPDDRSLAVALSRRVAQTIDSALLWETTQRELARRAAILRISRAFADSEPGSDRVMQVLLDEAQTMLGGDHGGIALWDAPRGLLVQVYSNTGRSNGLDISLDGSLSGRAALTRRPVIANEYQREYGRATPGGRFGAQAGIAAPLLHEGRLIGVISVGSRVEGHEFGPDDAEALELLAGMAASMLGTLERAQLQAVSLAARELAHRLNNDLALAVGTIDMLREEPTLGEELHELVREAAAGLERVADQLAQLQRLARFETRETPVGPALDLERSTGPGAYPG